MPKALIIGSTGQDGRILWGQLLGQGYSLVGVSSAGLWRGSVPVLAGPLCLTDPASVRALIRSEMPDEIYFLAARHHSSQESGQSPMQAWHECLELHVTAFVCVMQAVLEACPTARIFYASSSRVFGKAREDRQDEQTPMRPECAYGISKLAGMLSAHRYRDREGLMVFCGILFNHESALRGPAYVTSRVIDGLLSIREGHAGKLVLGDLDARVDWGYAPDYTRAMQAMLATGTARDYVVATGELHSVRDLVARVAGRLGMDWKDCVFEADGVLQRPAQGLCGDASLLRTATGWAPTLDFQRMVDSLVDSALDRRRAQPASRSC